MVPCVVERRKRELDSDQSKRDIDIYPMKKRHHMGKDSESHGISYGHGKEPAGGRPYKRKGRSDVNTSSSKSLGMSYDQRRKITQDSMY